MNYSYQIPLSFILFKYCVSSLIHTVIGLKPGEMELYKSTVRVGSGYIVNGVSVTDWCIVAYQVCVNEILIINKFVIIIIEGEIYGFPNAIVDTPSIDCSIPVQPCNLLGVKNFVILHIYIK